MLLQFLWKPEGILLVIIQASKLAFASVRPSK